MSPEERAGLKAHEPVQMAVVDRFNRLKMAGNSTGGRKWRVWTSVYACPICNARKNVLQNPNSGFDFVCSGDRITRAASLLQGQSK